MFHPQGPTFWELVQQALSSTERGYDLLAPKFDYTPFRTPDSLLELVAPLIGNAKSIDAALDLCCGTGAGMKMLRPLCRDRVVGIDFSHGMLEVAREATTTDGEPKLDFVHGDVLDLPFTDEFDVVVCFGALGHILPKNESRFIEQIAKALRPGGRFVFITTGQPSRLSLVYWLARGFNAAMHVRNTFIKPPFIMFYLTFLLPAVATLLEKHGFRVAIHDNVFPRPFHEACVVEATLKA
ncbi:MAG: class I SAM-dependent methyltransferase [Planctomycetaceae bacterium]|nr:class I SAM-dependent methyltransferase [Planctomycetales bacterium]MCB9872796.1 class I SAM-dependent methyltransferase [Planctomycetaceae bacterium]HRX78486.1 class I SAM-dependent methyltransferase [Pirellulaceae bacterium]